MRTKISNLIIIFISLLALPTLAQESSTSSIPMDSVERPKNKTRGEDVDEIITNSKMRAETGSKSKYSIASAFGYSAGSLDKPLGDQKPNITGATGSTDYTSLGGSISGKYAFTSQQAMLAGMGLRWITPLAGSKVPVGYNGNKFDLDNPFVSYQYLYRWAGIQSALELKETFFTTSDLVRGGYVTTWGLGQNNVWEIGTTGLSIGVNAYVGLGYFNKNSPEDKINQSDYSLGFLPALEYRLTDRLNLRTDSNLFIFQHLRSERRGNTYQRQAVTQSFGIGYAITRDFYVSPGVSWVPGSLRSDSTLVSLSANINLF